MLEISKSDFLKLTSFVKQRFGIDLGKKEQLIVSRLQSTVNEARFGSFEKYVAYITSTAPSGDVDLMLNKLTTNYTFFYREENHFELLRTGILPYLERTKPNKSLAIWSAGCSSGEEPYTISMILKDYFGKHSSWDTRVLATDISQNVLTKAQNSSYEEEELKNMPSHWKEKYFDKDPASGRYRVSKEIKDNVIFKTFNLMDEINFKRKFDVIFCRNVMIYFDQKTRDALVERFYDYSNPGAYLLIGHSESLSRERTRYKYITTATYRK
ncbi:MAG: protein-glutamate O-methyltransferase CheR [Peptostreptococcaceae bacterium]|nr:protein-glutamate O-methyltransferase CheR [Peptostreptococcaceae bacterium]